MDQTGAPQNWWFLALALSVLTWNVSAIEIKDTWTTPATMVGLGIPDISSYILFGWITVAERIFFHRFESYIYHCVADNE